MKKLTVEFDVRDDKDVEFIQRILEVEFNSGYRIVPDKPLRDKKKNK